MLEIFTAAPFALDGTIMPALPPGAFMTTQERLQKIAIICFIAGYMVRTITEKLSEKYQEYQEAKA